MGKLPYFPFFPGDWLSDPKLKSCSFRAKGVWADLIAISFYLPVPGVFRTENERLTDENITDMLTGKTREKNLGFKELVEKKILKRMEDKTYYCKRLYEICRLSEIRRQAGKKGGNPSLLLKQNPNQTDKQILDSSYSSSYSSSGSLKTNQEKPEIPDNKKASAKPVKPEKFQMPKTKKHFAEKVGTVLKDLKTACEKILKLPPKKDKFNPYQWLQEKVNENKYHPEALLYTLNGTISHWVGIKGNPYGYSNKILLTVNGNYNERDHQKESLEFKEIVIQNKDFVKLLEGIGD